jgi:hypothetical protein
MQKKPQGDPVPALLPRGRFYGEMSRSSTNRKPQTATVRFPIFNRRKKNCFLSRVAPVFSAAIWHGVPSPLANLF